MISCKEERLEVLCVWESLMTKWEGGGVPLDRKRSVKGRERERGKKGLPSGLRGAKTGRSDCSEGFAVAFKERGGDEDWETRVSQLKEDKAEESGERNEEGRKGGELVMDKERRLLFPSWLFKGRKRRRGRFRAVFSSLISMSLIGIFSYLSILLARSLPWSVQ
jgi:hypothetical protein